MCRVTAGATLNPRMGLGDSSILSKKQSCQFMTIYDNLNTPCFWRKTQATPSQGQATARRWSWLALVLVCVGLLGLPQTKAWAGDLPSPRLVSHVGLESHTTWLLDPKGNLTIEAVSSPAQSAEFAPLKGPLSLGFTRSVAWIKLDLSSAESASWLLEVGNPILEDVRFYERGIDGMWQVQHGTVSGEGEPRELNYRKPVFKVNLTAGVNSVFYLRLASRTAMVTNLKLTAPESLFESDTRESFIWGLAFGAYFLVMFFYSAFWVWTRERVHMYYVLYVGINLGSAFLTGRWSDMLGLKINANIHTLMLGVFICLSVWIAPVFTASFLKTHQIWPRGTRLLLSACASISAVCIGLVLLGFYGQGVMAIQIASILLILVVIGVSGHLAWKSDKKAQLLLLAFSLFYMGVVWRYMRNIGLIEPTLWNENVYQVGAFMHMMVMSTGIFSSYNALRRRAEQDQARANAQELQRQRQYEFLGMVSHEVRTPLTVITASADNLLLDSSLSSSTKTRVEKIIRHCGKLQHLFDSYLDNERLLNGDNPIQMSEVNLTALCEATVQDISDAHGVAVKFETDLLPNVVCNSDLVKVAITNLLENARKHTAHVSGITLQLRRSDALVRVVVTDQGPGIHDEDMPFIFDAYYRGKGAHPSKGSGLGLHLVKFIAEQHKGRVYAVKQEPQGMQFVFEIPMGKAPSSV